MTRSKKSKKPITTTGACRSGNYRARGKKKKGRDGVDHHPAKERGKGGALDHVLLLQNAMTRYESAGLVLTAPREGREEEREKG